MRDSSAPGCEWRFCFVLPWVHAAFCGVSMTMWYTLAKAMALYIEFVWNHRYLVANDWLKLPEYLNKVVPVLLQRHFEKMEINWFQIELKPFSVTVHSDVTKLLQRLLQGTS